MLKMKAPVSFEGIEYTHYAVTLVASPIIASDSLRIVFRLTPTRKEGEAWQAAIGRDRSIVISDTKTLTDPAMGAALLNVNGALQAFIDGGG